MESKGRDVVGVSLRGQPHLQHVQKRRLSCIVEAEEEQLGVLVQQAEGGEDIVDYVAKHQCVSASLPSPGAPVAELGPWAEHTPVDNPHLD